MNIASLSARQLRTQLHRGELAFGIGEFSVSLRSALPSVQGNIARLYADYPLAPDPALTDFDVALAPPSLLRRYFRPQVCFSQDGQVPFKPLPLAQSFAMFEWGLNWCVASSAHHYLVIHAAVAERNGHALILPGEPGSGKSTLCAALVNRGWRLLSDEMTLLGVDDGLVAPFPRPVSLKNASLDVIREFAPQAVFGEVVADTSKGTVGHMRAPLESVARSLELAVPAHIVMPTYREGAAARLQPLSRARAFMRIAENCFNYNVLGAEGFQTLVRLVERCDCYEFEYSVLQEGVEAMNELNGGAP